jgi:hypothetical protein
LRLEVNISTAATDHVIFDIRLLISISRWVNFLRTMRYFTH